MSFAARTTRYLWRRAHGLSVLAMRCRIRARKRAKALEELHCASFASITFVCQGNINRSALAEKHFRALHVGSAGPETLSCGLHLRGDRPSPMLSIEAASRLGVDLSSHSSRVAAEMTGAGTLLVGFEPHHLGAWRGTASQEAAGVLLGVFARDTRARLLIPDPYECEMPFVMAVFECVMECVENLSDHIVSDGQGSWRIRE